VPRARSLAIAIAIEIVLVAAAASAQQRPPRPGTAPGIFEGQGPPTADATWSTPMAARPENRADAPRRAAPTVLFTSNQSTAMVWVTVYRDGGVHASGCLRGGSSKSWELGNTPGRWSVRAEVSRNNDCLPPPSCETTIELQAGISAL